MEDVQGLNVTTKGDMSAWIPTDVKGRKRKKRGKKNGKKKGKKRKRGGKR